MFHYVYHQLIVYFYITAEAVNFWKALAKAADVPVNVYEVVPGYPIVVLKWAGKDSSQRSIMLNSHMDVVPADFEVNRRQNNFNSWR